MNTATTLPDDILRGMPLPRLGRWQPLRAKIVGIFRYDAQEFVFYNGRLLLRGNNGNGKSMALEVLLPYLLDADLSPERLSTFGGRSRGMYTWLLGHDKSESRDNARGYVWVEFGRVDAAGNPQYFTIGAGLEVTRSNKDVTAWYFTTAARFGVDLPALRPGEQAPKRDELATLLAQTAEQGLPGRIRKPSDHREECRKVLYGVDPYTYDALRKALLQLRKPKLSDKLSEQGLAQILRGALAPLDDAMLRSIAEGYEKLDDHHTEIGNLRVIRVELDKLQRAYAHYARAELSERATRFLAFADSVERASAEAARLASAAASLKDQVDRDEAALGDTRTTIATLSGTLEGLKASEDYREGKDLEPSRERTEALETLARELANAATTANDDANAAERTAGQHKTDTETALEHTATVRRDCEAAAAALTLLTDAHRDLTEQIAQHGPSLEPQAADQVRTRLDEHVGALRERIAGLHRIHQTATKASEAAAAADTAVEGGQEALDLASDNAELATQAVAALQQGLADEANAWAARSIELTAGEPAPDFDPATVEREAPAWTRRAREIRLEQLRRAQARVATARAACERLAEQSTSAAETARIASQEARQARRALDEASELEQQWRREVSDWAAQLTELTDAASAPPRPPVDAGPDAWQTWIGHARRAREQAIRAAAATAATEQASLTEQIRPLHDERETVRLERDQLLAGAPTPPPAPHTRGAERSGRPGAPLYTLVDFREDAVDAERAAMLEAALLASGLADAWVNPDGTILRPDGHLLLDTQLTPAAAVAHPLSTALRPDPLGLTSVGVPSDIVEALLASVHLAESAHDADVTDPAVTVGWNGTWRAGILHGAHRQQHAGLIGAASREHARQARIAVLGECLTQLDAQLLPLESRDQELAEHRRTLERATDRVAQEADTLPAHHPMADAASRAEVAQAKADSALAPVPPALAALTAHTVLAVRRAHDASLAAAHGTVLAQEPDGGDDAVPDLDPPYDTETLISALSHAEQAARDTVRQIGETLGTAARDLEHHDEVLQREAASCPASGELAGAHQTLRDREAERRALESALAEQRAAQRATRATAKEQGQLLRGALAEAGLDTPDTLTGIDQLVDTWHRLCGTYVQRSERADVAARASQRASALASRLRGAASAAKEKASEPTHAAVTARARYDAMVARLGATFTAIEQQITDLEAQLTAKGSHATRLEQAVIAGGRQLAVADEKADTATTRHRDLVEQTATRAEPLLAACREHLPESAGWDPPAETDLTVEGAPALARYLRAQAEAGARTEALETSLNNATKARHNAEVALSQRVTLTELWKHGVLVIEARRGNTLQTLLDTASAIRGQQIALENLINAEEAELLEKFLTADMRRQVVARISAARAQIKTMNSLMVTHGTTSGVSVKLDWVPDRKSGIGDDVVDLLGADFDTAPSARTRLMAFFAGRIDLIRAQHDGRSWYELLTELLDYRLWYKFDVMYRHGSDGTWTRLSSAEHGALSGGEKSVALHLPLFAAAAAHTLAATVRDTRDPSQPGCPRLILLDEVFAGVDEDNRGTLFDLIRTLGMDLIATSESETGMYAELDGIAIYHLITHQSLPGTLAVRSVWDGADGHNLLDHDLDRS